MTVSREEVLRLLVGRLAAVLAVPAHDITADARFDDDLHADSLDLVEVIEAVERVLAERGLDVSLPDEELLALETVDEAVDRLHAQVDRKTTG